MPDAVALTSWKLRSPSPGVVELYLIADGKHLLLTINHKQLWQSTADGMQILKNWPALTLEEKRAEDVQLPADCER